MSTGKLKKRIKEAQRVWQKEKENPDIEGLAGYMPGILRGFTESLRIIEDYQKEQLGKSLEDRKRLTTWNAVDLYRACERAYGRLKQSDRDGAIVILHTVLTHITPTPVRRKKL